MRHSLQDHPVGDQSAVALCDTAWFAEYARGCGAKGILVTDAAQLDAAMTELFAHNGSALLEIKTDVSLI